MRQGPGSRAAVTGELGGTAGAAAAVSFVEDVENVAAAVGAGAVVEVV